jgi:hypothetical protein
MQWVINGETWRTFKIAASDVPVNAKEVWCLESGGELANRVRCKLAY